MAAFGIFNSLSQVVLKLGSPGVADIYQGNELWDLSLVDPDNRRPVDFEARQRELQWLLSRSADPPRLVQQLLAVPEDGRIKLYISQRLLCLRRERPQLFVGGSYTPLRGHQHVAAFARAADGQVLVVAAPVQIATLMRGTPAPPIGPEVWREDLLPVPGEPGRQYCDVFTGRTHSVIERHGRSVLRLADVFGDLPVAALLG